MKILTIEESPILNIGVLTNHQDPSIEKIIVENKFKRSSLNRVYAGRIVNVVNSLEGAFVDIGLSQNAFIRKRDLFKALELYEAVDYELPLNRVVKAGTTIIAQVSKEPYQAKGAQLTGDISIEGMYVVLLPNSQGVKFSKKIVDQLLKDKLTQKIIERFGSSVGAIIRSSVSGVNNAVEAVTGEMDSLINHWELLRQRAMLEKKVQCLYDSESFYERLRQEVDFNTLDEIRTASETVLNRLKSTRLVKKVTDEQILSTHNAINQIIDNNRWRSPSGGSIVMDVLEAFTVIDINSEVQVSMLEKNHQALAVNQELTPMILEKLELLDISGIILIDYINMDKKNQTDFINYVTNSFFKKELGYQVQGFTKLGIFELTKKRTRTSLPYLLSFSPKKIDYLYWQLHELYQSVKKLQEHTNTKVLEIEVDEQMYSFLVQNNIFESLELKIKYKHRNNNKSSYKFITQ